MSGEAVETLPLDDEGRDLERVHQQLIDLKRDLLVNTPVLVTQVELSESEEVEKALSKVADALRAMATDWDYPETFKRDLLEIVKKDYLVTSIINDLRVKDRRECERQIKEKFPLLRKALTSDDQEGRKTFTFSLRSRSLVVKLHSPRHSHHWQWLRWLH